MVSLSAVLWYLDNSVCSQVPALIDSIRIADYPRDVIYPSNAIVAAVHVPLGIDPLSPEVIPVMRDRIRELDSQGTRVSVIILNNPHNPLGRVYPTETIIAYAALAEEVIAFCGNVKKVSDLHKNLV